MPQQLRRRAAKPAGRSGNQAAAAGPSSGEIVGGPQGHRVDHLDRGRIRYALPPNATLARSELGQLSLCRQSPASKARSASSCSPPRSYHWYPRAFAHRMISHLTTVGTLSRPASPLRSTRPADRGPSFRTRSPSQQRRVRRSLRPRTGLPVPSPPAPSTSPRCSRPTAVGSPDGGPSGSSG
jgi:hypothetical protein